MTLPDVVERRNYGRRSITIAAATLATALSVASVAEGNASDGNLQSVLLDAGCPNAKVETVSDRDGTITYRANCFSTSHKVIIVTCVRGVCAGGQHRYEHRQDNG